MRRISLSRDFKLRPRLSKNHRLLGSFVILALAFAGSQCAHLRELMLPQTEDQSHELNSHAPAEIGKVVRVSDGDTVVLLTAQMRELKIRLLGIDAPEKGQPFGNFCREELARSIAGKSVRVETRGTDRYERTLGKIVFEGRDINLAQVESGCAWHYRQFARSQPVADRELYAVKEQEAREAKRGLWQDKKPKAPWDFRRSK